jgi:hypothetical protein
VFAKLTVAVVDDPLRLPRECRRRQAIGPVVQISQIVLNDEASLSEIDYLIADIGMPVIDGEPADGQTRSGRSRVRRCLDALVSPREVREAPARSPCVRE